MPTTPDEPAPAGGKTNGGEILVFIVRRDTRCGECGEELLGGSFIRMDGDRALCLECADLGHLEFLGRGNAAVTRRASKYSPLRAVVVQWSRARKRYERQGILVSGEAIERAESESLADAPARERRAQRAAERQAELDVQLVDRFAQAVREQF